MSELTSDDPQQEPLWPNQTEVVDGVTPVDEVSQDPNFFTDEDIDLDRRMEG